MKPLHMYVKCFVIRKKIMKFEKEMRGNSGQLPHEHKIAIDGILSLQSPLIPKIHSYDDYYYKADYIDGLSLSKYIIDKGDALWCQKLLFDINSLYLKMSEITHKGFVLCADDVHGNNIKVTMSGQAYIVDLDQYCWVEPWQVFDHIQFMIKVSLKTVNKYILYKL